MSRTLTFTTTLLSQETRTFVTSFTTPFPIFVSAIDHTQSFTVETREETITTVVQLTVVSKVESVITIPAEERTETPLTSSHEGTPGGSTKPGDLITSAPIVSSSDTPLPALPTSTPPPPLPTSTTPHESLQSISSHPGVSTMSHLPIPSGVPSITASVPPSTITGPSLSPSPDSSAQGENQHRLSQILPAVILPTLFLVALGCFLLWKQWKRPRWEYVSRVVPFTTSNNTSRLMRPDRNHFTKSEQTLVGAMDRRTFKLPNVRRRSIREGPSDRSEGENVALGVDSDRRGNERSEEIQPVAQQESHTRTPDNVAIAATRDEILTLQARLADIEARRVSLPPPEYSSEVGELHEEGLRVGEI